MSKPRYRSREHVGFLVPTRIALYSAIPLIEEALRRDTLRVSVVAHRSVLDELSQAIKSVDFGLLDLTIFESARPIRGWLRQMTTWVFTSARFSPAYGMRMSLQQQRRRGWKAKVAAAVDTFGWTSGTRINRILDRAFRCSNIFPFDTVVVVTPGSAGHLLHARDLRVVALLESWDHPAKKPFGSVVDAVVPWNEELGKDWVRHQGTTHVIRGFPYKLRGLVAEPRPQTVRSRRVLYAATSSRITPYGTIFDEEHSLLDALVAELTDRGIEIIIKPKPASGRDDFQSLGSRRGVQVLQEGGAQSPTDYFFTEEYNAGRAALIAGVDCVITAATTFALDAAAAGTPVVQLDCRPATSRLPMLARASENEHLQNHILRHSDVTVPVTDDLRMSAATIVDAVERGSEAMELSIRLRQWLGLDRNTETVSREVLDAILSDF